MSSHDGEPKTLRFGVFEADLGKSEIRKHGVRLRLPHQPFLVLAALVERPGVLVTREELMHSLWADGTVVDFDRGLNAAISRLRQTLSDTAENPKYIETVAGRGYRFIAPVETVGNGVHQQEPLRETAEPTRMIRWAWFAIAVMVLLLAGATSWMTRQRPPQLLSIVPNTLMRLTADSGLTTNPALSPDGTLLAYASDRGGDGNLDIWVQQVADRGEGKPIRLTHGDSDSFDPAFSPDGRKIAFRSERDDGGIYVIPALGGDAFRVAAGGTRPRFSPDGKWIAYTVGEHFGAGYSAYFLVPGSAKIFVIPSSGGAALQICKTFSACAFPVWTPDSTHILFLGNPDPNLWNEPVGSPLPANLGLDWWLTSLDGGPAIATGTVRELRAAGFAGLSQVPQTWLDKGSGVLFSGSVGDTANLWVMPISNQTWKTSGHPYRLSSGTTREVLPTVAANGKLAFASVSQAWDLWSLPLDTNRAKPTGELRRLTQDATLHGYPSVSPDGTKIAFSNGNRDIWLKDLAAGGKETALTNTPAPEFGSSFSPDGSKLSYRATEGQKNVHYVRSLSDGAVEKICEGCSEALGWSADGTSILCVRCTPTAAISVLTLATGQKTDVTGQATDSLWNPRYSPDDRWMIFNEASPSRSRIFVARLHTRGLISKSEWIPLSDEQWADNPRWSPDGNSLYFLSDRDGFRCLWVQRLNRLTKHPEGPLAAVFHSHQARRSMGNIPVGDLKMSVARDKVVFNMGERTANIWMANLSGKP